MIRPVRSFWADQPGPRALKLLLSQAGMYPVPKLLEKNSLKKRLIRVSKKFVLTDAVIFIMDVSRLSRKRRVRVDWNFNLDLRKELLWKMIKDVKDDKKIL